MRVLLHSQPMLRLHANDDRRRPELRHYAALPLAMRVLDLIVENMGMVEETDAARVQQKLAPLLAAMDEEAGVTPDAGRHAEMTELLLGLLRNDDARRDPFTIPYTSFEPDGHPCTRELTFFLVREWYHPSGRIVLRLSNEALNLFLNALDLDIESAQAANEAMVADQMRRGKWADAARSAEAARANSIRYKQKVDGILRDTRRDLTRVDWAGETPRILDEALAYILVRHGVEQGVIDGAQAKLRELSPEDPNTAEVARVVRTMRECQQRHAELHTVLLGARDTFLVEQERQRFAPRAVRIQPDLAAGVLEPLLGMPAREAEAVLVPTAPMFVGARAEPIFSLAALIGWQLRPRRESHHGEVPVEASDPTYVEPELAAYSDEDRRCATDVLDSIQEPTDLSAVLQRAREAGATDTQCDLIALLVLREYAPEEDETPTLLVQRRDGHRLRDSRLHGDELDIVPRGEI